MLTCDFTLLALDGVGSLRGLWGGLLQIFGRLAAEDEGLRGDVGQPAPRLPYNPLRLRLWVLDFTLLLLVNLLQVQQGSVGR